jgi:hypothetical protein
VPSKSFRNDFFKNQRHEEDIYLFSIQNKLHWHIYRLLSGGTVSQKLLKIPLFGPSLIHQVQLRGSQQHPQSGVLVTSFSTWVTENSLAEINLDSTGVTKGCNIFGVKTGKHFTYFGKQTRIITKLFQETTVRTTHNVSNTIGKILSKKPHNQDSKQLHQQSGIYSLTCPDCHKKYVGQTCILSRKDLANISTTISSTSGSQTSPRTY